MRRLQASLPAVCAAAFAGIASVAACGAGEARPQVAVVATPTVAPPPPAPAARAAEEGPHGESAAIQGRDVVMKKADGTEVLIAAADLHPPTGDPALHAVLPTTLLYLEDGTLLVGVADGTVTAIDGDGHRRWSLGFRGAVYGLTPGGDGLVAVTTEKGVVALVTSSGRERWERQLTVESVTPAVVTKGGVVIVAGRRGVIAFSPAGDVLFTHAAVIPDRRGGEPEQRTVTVGADGAVRVGWQKDKAPLVEIRMEGPHPPIPSIEPTFPLSYRRVVPHPARALVRTGPSSMAALVDGARKGRVDVARLDATGVTSRVALPSSARRELFVKDAKAEASPIEPTGLVLGRPGQLRVLGFRASSADLAPGSRFNAVGAGALLEVDATRATERRDLFKHFFDHAVRRYSPIVASSDGTMICFGEDAQCLAPDGDAARAIAAPERVTAVAHVGAAHWLVTASGAVIRSDGSPVPGAPNDVTGLAVTSDQDVWAVRQGLVASRFDGSTWTETPLPRAVGAAAARGPDDVWSDDGTLHWDGKRWSLVYGAPAATSVAVLGANDVWLAGPLGVWNGSAPGVTPVRLALAPSSDDGAAPPPAPLPLESGDASYATERARFASSVKGEAPVERARRAVVARDGTLWLDAIDRVVEVATDGTATTVRSESVDSFARWFLPEGPGRGLAVTKTIEHIGGSAIDERLPNHDVVALDAARDGAAWLVGRVQSTYSDPREAELAPHALFRPRDGASFVPVVGLPSAEWCDVAADAGGGAWFAGALDRGPEGEGILFHARGRAGVAGSTRVRALATLFAVAAVGNVEGWAVGAAGTIVHVGADGAVARHVLSTGEWLRAVAARAPDDVWIAGDGGTLIHFDGHAFRPVDHPLGAHAAFTSVVFVQGAVLATSPSGILRITRRS